MMIVNCKNCKFHAVNFWGYQECWKFDQQLDAFMTTHTATRERDAKRLNKYNDCEHYIGNTLVRRIYERICKKFERRSNGL